LDHMPDPKGGPKGELADASHPPGRGGW
jgi:hypothetical protein